MIAGMFRKMAVLKTNIFCASLSGSLFNVLMTLTIKFQPDWLSVSNNHRI